MEGKPGDDSAPRQRILAGWMGPGRDARVDSLPESLPDPLEVIWERGLLRSGLGGVAATDQFVLFGDRDTLDFSDVWSCWDAQTGETLWEVHVPAPGKLDYGNSPRCTPLIVQEELDGLPVPLSARAYVLGAFGNLVCLDMATGLILWQRNLADDFQAKAERPWGYCGSPLLAAGKLIVAPGAPGAAVAALDPMTGETLWRGDGEGLGHGSLIEAELGGVRQIVGHDGTTLGGWELETGERLWTLKPEFGGDFNVTTPIVHAGSLLVATENNGTRLYDFDTQGRIQPSARAHNTKLHPDMSTPLPAGNHLVAVHRFLYCLDLENNLKELFRLRDPAFGDYAPQFTDGKRLLIAGKGELLLIDPRHPQPIRSRTRIFEDSVEIYSHPTLLGNRLFIRGDNALKCLQLP